jgi:hypothetical protein
MHTVLCPRPASDMCSCRWHHYEPRQNYEAYPYTASEEVRVLRRSLLFFSRKLQQSLCQLTRHMTSAYCVFVCVCARCLDNVTHLDHAGTLLG